MKGILAIILFGLNILFWCLLLYFFVLLKILIPWKKSRQWYSKVMVAIAENWISVNSLNMALLYNIQWDVSLPTSLQKDRSYLVCANHQSWVDILVLQHAFNKRIPFLRFFIKQSLLYVPVLGGAWWALDFPFMKRYSKEYLEKHPEKRGEDLATTRRACEKFRGKRISILNFLEGTRFTQAKHKKQNSPYKNLLKPKAGGLGFVIESMGEQFHSLLDVTIRYPDGVMNMWEFLCGKIKRVQVQVEEIMIPEEFLLGQNYLEDPAYREKFQMWVQEIWQNKDYKLTHNNKF